MITVEKINGIIKGVCVAADVDNLDPNTPLREYGIDSLDYFSIIIELQDMLGKTIPDEDIDQLRTVAQIQAYLEKHGL